MIVIDLQQVMLANLAMQLKGHMNAQLDENMLRHMVLNSIRGYKTKFGAKYGELVIACDSRHTWRKQMFPYYKIRRKKARSESELDWTTIFESLGKIRAELKEFFPYRVVEVEGAEADDIIGTLAAHFGDEGLAVNDPILIVSGDKDFKQLLKFANVEIYDPIKKVMTSIDNAEDFLFELVMRGDPGDDVPNVLSQDDSFALGVRQKQLRDTKIEELKNTPFEQWPEHVQRNFHRNKKLIDLSEIPTEIKEMVLTKYEEQAGKGRSKLFSYFVKNKLTNLLESLQEF